MANSKRNWGKEIKDVGMLIIIIGVISRRISELCLNVRDRKKF